MAQESIPKVPTTWPGGFGLYKYSKQAVQRNWQTILALEALGIAVSAIGSRQDSLISFVADLVNLLIGLILVYVLVASVKGQKITLEEGFKKVSPEMFVKYFVQMVLLVIIAILSLAAFIVPFFFILPRIFIAQYYLVDGKLGIIESIQASWDHTKGHALQIWGVIGAALAMALLMITIVGIPFSLYFLFMYLASPVLIYEFLRRKKSA